VFLNSTKEETMFCQKKYTVPEGTDQAAKLIDEEWEEQVLSRLPAETEEQAFRLRAFVREGKIKSVGDLLRALLAYVLCVSSFRQLGSWAVLLGIANISDTAWRKRLSAASAWLLWLLADPQPPVKQNTCSGFGRIILVDATRLKQVGGNGDDWRVHSAYDLRARRLIQLLVTDQHTAESLQHFHLEHYDLLIKDSWVSQKYCVCLSTAGLCDSEICSQYLSIARSARSTTRHRQVAKTSEKRHALPKCLVCS
jgi:hypothetical protein